MIMHMAKENGKPKCGQVRGWSFWVTKDPDKVTCKKCLGTAKHATVEPITDNMVGKVLRYSFGYDMTINVYAKVIRQTAKALVCKECYASVQDDYGKGEGRSTCGEVKEDAKEFMIKRMKSAHGYEHWSGAGNCWQVERPGEKHYYNTWD